MQNFSSFDLAGLFGMTNQNILLLINSEKLTFSARDSNSGKYLFTEADIIPFYKKYISDNPAIFCCANIKGGTGKTFFTYIFSLALKAMGFKVLVVDLDEQANLTEQFLDEAPGRSELTAANLLNGEVFFYYTDKNDISILDEEKSKNAVQSIIKSTNMGVDILPSNLSMATKVVKGSFDVVPNFSMGLKLIKNEYDFIIIDTPPTISIQTEAAISSADYILPIITPSKWPIVGIEWLHNKVKSMMTNADKIIGCVYNQVEIQKKIHQEFIEKTKDGIAGIKIYESTIPKSVVYEEMIVYRENPFLWTIKKKNKYKKALQKIFLEIMYDTNKKDSKKVN